MRYLVLAPQDPSPNNDGGKRSIFGLVAALSGIAEVTLAVPRSPDGRKDSLLRLGVSVHYLDLNTKDSLWTVVSNIGQRLPFKFSKYFSSNVANELIKLARAENADAVIACHAHVAEYALAIKHRLLIPALLREHNLEFSLVEQYSNDGPNALARAVASWQAPKTRSYETSIWRHFDAVYFISDNDLYRAQKLVGRLNHLHGIPDGVDELPLSAPPTELQRTFLFGGPLTALQNRAALTWFIRDVWPRYEARHQEARLTIVGTEPARVRSLVPEIQRFEAAGTVSLVGFVPDYFALLRTHCFLVSPSRIGSGLRIKILEALVHGVVVVCTPPDVQMLSALAAGKNVLEFTDGTSFENAIEETLSDLRRYSSIRQAGYETVRRSCSWARLAEAIIRDTQRHRSAAA